MSYKFDHLKPENHYDIIDPVDGHWVTQGIQGAEALNLSWEEGAEAWPAGEDEFRGQPSDVAS